ncbi:WD40 repeat protein [Neolewinella xylanilytica]|uniref:WD40 repeat protein n=1 Tax=Neolewinella xylanilytica TaxID=1514080 RepID=A0A2S6I7N8_9BACT|nr:OmpA family protein [Neolewinella xylanilytica]PPK87459.1 WD40 repeat protein [Neolewinella xylanilytica]
MADYLKFCLALAGLLCGYLPLAAQTSLGPNGVRERDPVLTAAGDVLYFTRPDYTWNQGADDLPDVWIRHRDRNGRWQRAINPGSPINSFGPDRPLGVSVEGDRLAVYRGGGTPSIDLLERSGRNWAVTDTWSLPPEARDPDNLTFNVNSLTLVYGAPRAGGSRDLYVRYAETDGNWSPAWPLAALNSDQDEGNPRFAADGRTLLFRRSGRWFRQADRQLPAEAIAVASQFMQVAAAPTVVVGMTDEVGKDERIEAIPKSDSELVPPAALHAASLGVPPGPGELTATVPLNNGVRLRVYPDRLGRYAILLREGEIDFPDSAVPPIEALRPPGSLANIGPVSTPNRQAYLREQLEARQEELDRLDALRRELAFTRTPAEVAEFRPNDPGGTDTLPPELRPADTDSTRAKYAQALSELERMKEEFRQQQRSRARERDAAEAVYFTAGGGELASPDLSPGPVDTAGLRTSIRRGLYTPQLEPLTGYRGWENELRNDRSNAGQVGRDEIARLDAEYARQMEAIRVLRSQLRVETRRQSDTLADRSLASHQFTHRAVAPVGSSLSMATRLSVTFVPNTAYLDSGGYTGIDRLAEHIRNARSTVEIRVHTAAALDGLAAQRLSEERAATIAQRLGELGVPSVYFRVIGYGNNQPEGGERVEAIVP